MLCNYGCGQEAKYQFKNGKWCCKKNWQSCSNSRRNSSNYMKENPSKGMSGKHHSEESKEKISNSNKGKVRSEEYKEKVSGENNSFYGKNHTEESKKLMSELARKREKRTLTEEHKRNISKSHKGTKRKPFSKEWKRKMSETRKKLYLDQNFCEIYSKTMNTRPNKAEKKLIKFLNKCFQNQYEFVGDFKVWIGGKNPDFINKENNKIIELFGTYWHSEKITGICERKNEENRINYFRKYGYKTLIIWENELRDLEKLKNKIIYFNKENYNV